jgi:hypothetical protein
MDLSNKTTFVQTPCTNDNTLVAAKYLLCEKLDDSTLT